MWKHKFVSNPSTKSNIFTLIWICNQGNISKPMMMMMIMMNVSVLYSNSNSWNLIYLQVDKTPGLEDIRKPQCNYHNYQNSWNLLSWSHNVSQEKIFKQEISHSGIYLAWNIPHLQARIHLKHDTKMIWFCAFVQVMHLVQNPNRNFQLENWLSLLLLDTSFHIMKVCRCILVCLFLR